jgi:intracellular multiplication protein IcmT
MSMAHWRDSARPARLWIVDFRAAFPLFIFLLHIRLWTFLLAVIATLFFAMLERFGFTVAVFSRWIRAYIAGPRKIAQPWWKD